MADKGDCQVEQRYSAPAVARMLRIVELLAKSENGYSINELARLTEVSVNSVYRICLELESSGYLVKDQATGFYVLGSGFYYLGKAAESRIDLRRNAYPLMTQLCEATGETVHLTVLHGRQMVLIEQVETSSNIRMHVDSGMIMELNGSAFGKCLLAHCPDPFIEEYLQGTLVKMTARTLTDPAQLKQEIDKVKETGIAYDCEEYVDGVICIGAPVFGTGQRCVAAIGTMFPKFRTDRRKLREIEQAVRDTAGRLSVKMGGESGE